MKYFLWIDGNQDGPFDLELIREMLADGQILNVTLALPEDGVGEWQPLSKYSGIVEPPKPPEPLPTPPLPSTTAPKALEPEFSLPKIEGSELASFLTFIGALELIASPIAGFVIGTSIGSDSEAFGWMIFIGGFTGGLVILGFAQIIANTFASSQRLRRIEMLIQKMHDDKDTD